MSEKRKGSDSDSDHNVEKEDDEEVEDEIVLAILNAQKKKDLNHPPDITLDKYCPLTTLCFHPEKDIISLANAIGKVALYEYSNTENSKLCEKQIIKDNFLCREMIFNPNGDKLFCTFDTDVVQIHNVETLKKIGTFNIDVNREGSSSIETIDENTFVVGDEAGVIWIFDERMKKEAWNLKIASESVNCMISNSQSRIVVGCSSDGTLSSANIRGRKIGVKSEDLGDELSAMAIVKEGEKFIVGGSSEKLLLFNWGEFGYYNDVYPCKADTNALIAISDNIVLSGGEDGKIQATHFYPQKRLGIVGSTADPIVKMDICNDGHLVGSIGHEDSCRFWNIGYFQDFLLPTKEAKKKKKSSKKIHNKMKKEKLDNLPSSRQPNRSDFFNDIQS